MKKIITEFKKFISRGNIVDLSVAVIIGSAFSAIVTAFTDKIIMPIVNLLLSFGGDGLTSAFTFLKKAYDSEGGIDLANSIYIDWGAFITSIINFFIIALTIFTIVKIINLSTEKFRQFENIITNKTKKELVQERKKLKKQAKIEKRPFEELWTEYETQQKEIAKKEAEERAKKELEEKLSNPTQEELLKQIRDLLIEQNKKNI